MSKVRKVVLLVALSWVAYVAGNAWAGALQRGVYEQVGGSAVMPDEIVVRCAGWAEDSAARLRVIDYDPERVVYRCVQP